MQMYSAGATSLDVHCCDSNQVAVLLQMVQIELEQSEAYVKELQGQSAEIHLRTTNKVISRHLRVCHRAVCRDMAFNSSTLEPKCMCSPAVCVHVIRQAPLLVWGVFLITCSIRRFLWRELTQTVSINLLSSPLHLLYRHSFACTCT